MPIDRGDFDVEEIDETRRCYFCGNEFKAKDPDDAYCSYDCQQSDACSGY